MDIGTGITQMLAAVGITAAELSRRSGITPGTISSYQSGRTTPSLHALELIASALGVRLSELIARAETAQTEPIPVMQEERHEYHVGGSIDEVLAVLSAMSERQRRALLNFLQAMGE